MTRTLRGRRPPTLLLCGASIALALAGCAGSPPVPAPPAENKLPPKPAACTYRPKVPNLVKDGDADAWMGKAIVVIVTAETKLEICDGHVDDLHAAKTLGRK